MPIYRNDAACLIYDLAQLLCAHLTEPGRSHFHKHPYKEKLILVNQTSDNKKFVTLIMGADIDAVPAGEAPVTCVVQDENGNDLSKWIDVQPAADNPAQFSFIRKPDDGSQPPQLAFTAIFSATSEGSVVSAQEQYEFLPGPPVSLTATTTVEPLTPAPDAKAA